MSNEPTSPTIILAQRTDELGENESSQISGDDGFDGPMSGPHDSRWSDACLKYFKAKYVQRLQKVNWTYEPFTQLLGVLLDPNQAKYPLPESFTDDGIMPNLLNDRLFYLALFSMEYGGEGMNSYKKFLWEMFGTYPGSVLELCATCRSRGDSSIQQSLSYVEEYLDAMSLESPLTFEAFLESVKKCLRKPNPASFRSTLVQLRDRLLELQSEYAEYGLAAIWNSRTYRLPLSTFSTSLQTHLPTVEYPLYHGLQLYLQKHQESFLTSVVQHSLNRLPSLDDSSIYRGVRPPASTPDSETGVTLLFDTAGTGKTTAVQDRIVQSYGFYCASPNLLPSNIDSGHVSSAITPDRAFTSQDTYSVYADFKALAKLNFDSPNWEEFLMTSAPLNEISIVWEGTHPTQAIITARYQLLKVFRTLLGRSSDKRPEHQIQWLQLQTSCWLGNDPFDAAYRFLRLQTFGALDEELGEAIFTEYHDWAFDEAQEALKDNLAEEIMVEIMTFTGGPCLVSGTSLNLQKMRELLYARGMHQDTTVGPRTVVTVDDANFFDTLRSHSWSIIKELHALSSRTIIDRAHDNFPLISRGGRTLGFSLELPSGTWEDVQKGLQKWYIFVPESETGRSAEFVKYLAQVRKSSRILFGRIRWTALFAEELLRVSPGANGRLTAQDVENATETVANVIKRSLKDRMNQCKDTHWINELYWTAIEADVYSMTRIFCNKEAVELISEGFALVHVDSKMAVKKGEGGGRPTNHVVKGRLQEPLAIKAVIEYLRDPTNGDLYDKLMNRFFANLQIDRGKGGALGKLAEYIFTAVSIQDSGEVS